VSCACRIHSAIPQAWDWSGAAAAAHRPGEATTAGGTGSIEAARELAELQLAYHQMVSEAAAAALLATFDHGTALDLALDSLVRVRMRATRVLVSRLALLHGGACMVGRRTGVCIKASDIMLAAWAALRATIAFEGQVW
jgi:hypothetical protein